MLELFRSSSILQDRNIPNALNMAIIKIWGGGGNKNNNKKLDTTLTQPKKIKKGA